MKSYLNRTEKAQALTLAAFIAYVTERADEWAGIGRSKDAVKSLRMARSFVARALDSMFAGLDDLERHKIMGMVAKMEVVAKYKDDAIREYNRMLALDSVTPVQTTDLIDICELAIGQCRSCSEIPNRCKWRELFIRYDIPVCNESPEAGECPYREEGESV